MYSGKFPCSLIIIKSKKRVSSTKDYSVHIGTQINIDPVHFTFSPENYATFARSLQWFHCAIYFGTICYRYQR